MDDGSLRITDTQTADQGDYICSASNTIIDTVKTATATAGLTVFSKSSSFFCLCFCILCVDFDDDADMILT